MIQSVSSKGIFQTHITKSYPYGSIDKRIGKINNKTLTIMTESMFGEITRKLYWLVDDVGKLLKYKYLMLEKGKVKKILQNSF